MFGNQCTVPKYFKFGLEIVRAVALILILVFVVLYILISDHAIYTAAFIYEICCTTRAFLAALAVAL